MNNKLTTISFLSCIREAIDLTLNSMEGLSEKEKSGLSKFIVNEATDYEILYFSYTGNFPEEKYNTEAENYLFETLKLDLSSNSFDLIESGIFTEESVEDLVESLVPLSEQGLSSSKTILEYMDGVGLLVPLLEKSKRTINVNTINPESDKERKFIEKRMKQDIDYIKKRNKDSMDRFRQHRNLNRDDFALQPDSELEKNKNVNNIRPEEQKYIDKRFEEDKNYIMNRNDDEKRRIIQHRNYNRDDYGTKQPGFKSSAKYSKPELITTSSKPKNTKKEDRGTLWEPKGKTIWNNPDDKKGFYGDKPSIWDNPEEVKHNSNSASDIVKTIKNHPVGATVLVGALLYGAYKTYKHFFSKSSKICAGKSGAEKDACIEKFKANAKRAQISDLKRSLTGCKNTNNPQKCQMAIKAKINKLQVKL